MGADLVPHALAQALCIGVCQCLGPGLVHWLLPRPWPRPCALFFPQALAQALCIGFCSCPDQGLCSGFCPCLGPGLVHWLLPMPRPGPVHRRGFAKVDKGEKRKAKGEKRMDTVGEGKEKAKSRPMPSGQSLDQGLGPARKKLDFNKNQILDTLWNEILWGRLRRVDFKKNHHQTVVICHAFFRKLVFLCGSSK